MKDEEKIPLGCGLLYGIFCLATVALPVYLIYLIFHGLYEYLRPDFFAGSLELLKALLLFFGGSSLFIWCFLMLPVPKYLEEDILPQDRSPWHKKLFHSPVILLIILAFGILNLLIPVVAFYIDVIVPYLNREKRPGV